MEALAKRSTAPGEQALAAPAAYSLPLRLIHLALVGVGIAAWLTALLAEDRSDPVYWLHVYLGFTTGFIVLCRFAGGIGGQPPLSFAEWIPLHPRQLRLALADLVGMLRLRLPERRLHEGIAGLVQAFGLLLFAWIICTGMLMFLLDGEDEVAVMLQNAHQIAEPLIPAFLLLHVGGVLVHTLAGHAIWRRMFSLLPGSGNYTER